MSRTRVTPDVLESVVRRVVREEQPSAPLPAPPNDLDAEQVVLCSLLERPCNVSPLEARHFYGDSNRLIFAAVTALRELGAEPTDDRIAITADRLGVVIPLLSEELDTIRDATPTCVRLSDYIYRIIDAHRRREALRHVETAAGCIRHGVGDPLSALNAAVEVLRA